MGLNHRPLDLTVRRSTARPPLPTSGMGILRWQSEPYTPERDFNNVVFSFTKLVVYDSRKLKMKDSSLQNNVSKLIGNCMLANLLSPGNVFQNVT